MSAQFLSIPVRVCADTNNILTLQVVDSIQDCPQCAAGKGCGQNLWFRGMLGNDCFTLPRPTHLPENIQFLELNLSSAVLTQLSIMLYGLPLLSFLITLLCTQALSAWLQFFLALLALSATIMFGKNWRNQCLQQYLQITIAPNKHIT